MVFILLYSDVATKSFAKSISFPQVLHIFSTTAYNIAFNIYFSYSKENMQECSALASGFIQENEHLRSLHPGCCSAFTINTNSYFVPYCCFTVYTVVILVLAILLYFDNTSR